jgi:ring-1,2-phenylacetyl-CoA epoxidase subunit PaaE
MAFGLFKKKQKNTQDSRYKQLKIKEVVHAAKDAVVLVFDTENELKYQPGQFITIVHEVSGKKIRRAYSLCSTPYLNEDPAVSVKRVPGGQMSNHINDHFKAGDEVEIMDPMGSFTTDYGDGKKRHAVFIGGGSGITPLYSILRTVLLEEPESRVSLIYGNRSEEFVMFKEELAALEASSNGRFELIHMLEDNTSGLASVTGRPTPKMIGEIIEGLKVNDTTEFYICGPEPMMDVATSGLGEIGIDDKQIRLESFEAGKTAEVATDSESGSTSEVTIVLDGEEHMVEVKKSGTILDAGLEADLDMPYSCQSGLCTACRAKCIEGRVDQEDAEGLSEAEIEEGYVLLCIGKPISDKIRVEIG